jgi:signal peptidase I
MKKNYHFQIQKVFKFFLNLFHYVLLILSFLMMLFSIFGSLETTLKYCRFTLSKVPTESMFPNIKPGDYVLIKYISEEEKKNLKESSKGKQNGDIIVFERNSECSDCLYIKDKAIIHRVVQNNKRERKVTTKGDHNQGIASWETDIPYNDIKAKYILRIPEFYIYFVFLTVLILFMFDVYLSYIRNNDKTKYEMKKYEE